LIDGNDDHQSGAGILGIRLVGPFPRHVLLAGFDVMSQLILDDSTPDSGSGSVFKTERG
jgi:hypothetical protein